MGQILPKLTEGEHDFFFFFFKAGFGDKSADSWCQGSLSVIFPLFPRLLTVRLTFPALLLRSSRVRVL